MREKSLKDISWLVSEETYREDSALSYSTLATYERGGFNCILSLSEKKESPALTFGSAVDAIITGGEEEFNSRFIVAEFPNMSDKAVKIIKSLFDKNHIVCRTFEDISEAKVLDEINAFEYWSNCKSETKLKKLNDEGVSDYYNLLQLAENKILINSDTYSSIMACINVLRDSITTDWYFRPNDPFDDSLERLYQLKFKATLHGINYRCMADLLIVDYANKIIYPIDLKTSSHPEWEFHKSFVQWNYQIQARLYWRIIRANLDKDEYFKDFTLADYKFIVVNKATLTPLVWEFKQTQYQGEIAIDKLKLRDPEDIGKELFHYLQDLPDVPDGIKYEKQGVNDIMQWLVKDYG